MLGEALPDEPAQFSAAERLFASYEQIFLPTTVLLECEWVLRYVYEFSQPVAQAALKGVCGLSNVTLENSRVVALAFEWGSQGMEFADALHLAAGREIGKAERFATFDQKLKNADVAIKEIEILEP